MPSREVFAVERDENGLHTIRVNVYPSTFMDMDTHKPVILGWSADSVTLQIVKREEVVAETRLIEMVSDTTRGRRDNYGRPLVNFMRIAALWHDYLAGQGKIADNTYLTPEDVAFLMMLLKVARAEHSYQNDNLIDIIGYADCMDDMNRQMQELGFIEGLGAFKTMTAQTFSELAGNLLRDSKA